jgi:hypothetical protein
MAMLYQDFADPIVPEGEELAPALLEWFRPLSHPSRRRHSYQFDNYYWSLDISPVVDTAALEFAGALSTFTAIVPPHFLHDYIPVPDDPHRAHVRDVPVFESEELIRVLLDPLHADYADVIAALNVESIEDTVNGEALKLVTAQEPTSRTGDLAAIDWPSALGVGVFKDEYRGLADFMRRGHYVLGLSTRPVRYIRPQLGLEPTSNNYGTGDSLCFGNAANGPHDPVMNGGTDHTAQSGELHYWCDGAIVRPGNMGAGGNPLFSNGGGDQGKIAVEDATGLGETGKLIFRGDYPGRPGMPWGSYTLWEREGGGHGWTDCGGGIWCHPQFQNTGLSGRCIGKTGAQYDADVDDVTVSCETLYARHGMKGVDPISQLNGAGGRARYFAQESFGGADQPWDRVLFDNGSGVWTDLTTPANDATVDDWTLFPVGAANGSRVVFVSSTPASILRLNLSQALVGATIGLTLSQGSGVFAAPPYLSDPSSGLTSGLSMQSIVFVPQLVHAPDTFASGEAFEATGYGVVLTKTAGSVTQAAVGDQTFRRSAAVYIHRWNDAAPTRGLTINESFKQGYKYVLSAKSNYEFVNFRMFGCGFFDNTIRNCAAITFKGCQLAPLQTMQTTGGTTTGATYAAADDGERWWSIDDHLVQSPNDPIFTDTRKGLVAFHGDSPSWYLDIDRWTDVYGMPEGPYLNGGSWPVFVLDGAKFRNTADQIVNMQGDVLFTMFNFGANDNHTLAARGNFVASTYIMRRFGVERFISNEIYTPATGGTDAPVSGSSSSAQDIKFEHGYVLTWNGREDGQQPNHGFAFFGDSDRGPYGDGSGLFTGNEINFVYFKDLNYSFDVSKGIGIAYGNEQAITVNHCTADSCNWFYRINHGVEQAIWAFRYDESAGTYEDITDLVKPTANPAAPGIDMFPASPAAGDMFIVGMKSIMNIPPVRCRLSFTNVAVMGTAVVSTLYYGSAGWTASTPTAGGELTASNTLRIVRPSDFVALNINGTTYYCLAWRLDSGTFSTPPTLNQINGRLRGASAIFTNCVVANPLQGVGHFGGSSSTVHSGFIRSTGLKVIYGAGQDDTTPLWAFGSDTANQNAAAWQGNEKLASVTDAIMDSVFDPDLVTEAA